MRLCNKYDVQNGVLASLLKAIRVPYLIAQWWNLQSDDADYDLEGENDDDFGGKEADSEEEEEEDRLNTVHRRTQSAIEVGNLITSVIVSASWCIASKNALWFQHTLLHGNTG
jgi:hypothetical protein